MAKKFSKEFSRDMARWSMLFFAWLFTWIPYPVVRGMTTFLLKIGFKLTKKQKKLAKESLQIAFGDQKTEEEIDQIIKDCFENIGRGMVEMLYFMAKPKYVDTNVTVEGIEHIDEALKQGKGIIAVTAHFGNFPMMMLRLAKQGYDTSSIIRPARDKKLEEYLYKRRLEFGFKTVYAVPRKKCVLDSIKALRDNGILFVPLDQNFGNGKGVFVDFFGRQAATATGPMIFHLRTGAPILPIFILRTGYDTHKIVVHPPMEIVQEDSEEKTIHTNITRITKIIEDYIRKYPYEWGWMHRRWKTQPSELNT